MAAPYITAAQVGTYFVTQYYQMLQHRPDLVHQLYSDASTLIRVDGLNRDTASGMMQIHTLVMSLRYSSIEIKTSHSLESWNGGVIIMVTGSVQLSDFSGRKKFAQTFFLAPQEKGYFVINDIFHFIDDDHIHPYPTMMLPQNNLHAKLNVPSTVQESVPNYMMGGPMPMREYMPAPEIKENGCVGQYSLPEQRKQQVQGADAVLDDTSAEQVNNYLETPVESIQEISPSPVVEPVEEPQKHTYASILRVSKGQSGTSAVHHPQPNKNTVSGSEGPQLQQNHQPGNQQSQQLHASSPANQSSGAEAGEEVAMTDDKGDIKSVYVRGLPPTLLASDIEEQFRKFGRLGPAGVAIRRVKDTDVCYAFIEFEDMTGVQSAIQAATVEVGGRQLYIEERRANSSYARGRRGRGRGNGQSEGSRGRFGVRSFMRGGSQGNVGVRGNGNGNGNVSGYYRRTHRQERGYSGNGQTQQEIAA